MNYIKTITLIALLISTRSLLAMEQASLKSHNALTHLSNGPASTGLLERLTYVKNLMIEQNLLDKNTSIHLGYLTQSALKDFEKDGCPTHYNALTNGIDTILVEKHLEDLPQDQQDSALAHEVAHIALRKKGAHLNPHNWLNNALLGSAEVARWASIPLLLLGVTGTKENVPLSGWRKKCAKAGAGCVAVALSNALVIPLLLGMDDTGIPSQPIEYPIMQKPEEIICDLLAATIIPDGGQKGAQLYRTKLECNGNRNGKNDDHPYTATRVWYHDQVAQLQKNHKI